jgi:hypothetical protein
VTKPSFTQFTGFIFHVTVAWEKCAVQVYISASIFITVNENTKQTSECSYEKRNTDRTES